MKVTIGKIGRKSMVKFSKWGLAVLSVVFAAYFVYNFVVPAFGTVDATNSYANTTTSPPNWTKNGTGEWFNFTIRLSNGNVTAVNITVPNTTTAVNFSVENVTAGFLPTSNDTLERTWTVTFPQNHTGTVPWVIMFSTDNRTGFNKSVRFDIYATAQVAETGDRVAQNWSIRVKYNDTDAYNGQFNSSGFYTYVDSRTPSLNTTTPVTGGFISGNNSQLFQVFVDDRNLNIATKNASLYYKASGATSWYGSESNTNCYQQGSPSFYICNITVNSIAATLVGDGENLVFFFNASDNVTNVGYNGTSTSPLTVTIDRTAPTNTSTSIEKVASGTKYDTAGALNYGFQMDWTDSGSGVYNVTFESNFTGAGTTFANVTAGRNGAAYTVNFTITNFKYAGTYAYKWYANDSVLPGGDSNWANSSTFYYTIATADNPVTLYLNNTENTNVLDLRYPARVNATGVVTAGEMILWRNVSGTWTDVSAAENRTYMYLPFGVHNYIVNTSGNANYSTNNSGVSYYMVVNQGTANVSLYLNGTEGNVTVASSVTGLNTVVNITVLANNYQGVVWIYNGTDIANQTFGNTSMNITTWRNVTSGTKWNITAYYNGSQNYSASSPRTYYIIIESTPPTYLENYTNVTVAKWGKYQGLIWVNAVWSDQFNLSRVWMYNNTTAVWGNTYGTFGTNNVSNFSIDPSRVNIAGGDVVIQAIVYANDTSNNTNSTNTFQWVIDGTPPALRNIYPANNSFVAANASYPFRVNVTDDTLNLTNVTLYYKKSSVGAYTSAVMTCSGTASPFACIKSNVDLTIYGDGDIIYYYYEASDNSSILRSNGTATQPLVVTIDISSPKYSNNNTNTTLIGKYDPIKIYANWTDVSALDSFIVELIAGGDKWNVSECKFVGGSCGFAAGNTWSNYSYAGNSTGNWVPGTSIGYKIYANDTSPNWNVTPMSNFTIENTPPLFYNNGTNVSTGIIAKGTPIMIYANWTDNMNISKVWVEQNFTVSETLNNITLSFGAGNWTNYTLVNYTLVAGKSYYARLFANDTSGNENVTVLDTGIYNWTVDSTGPMSNNATRNGSAVNGSIAYATNTVYIFNVSWTDNLGDSAVSTVLLNFSYSATNYTATSLGRSNYSVVITDLPVGNYSYRWYANDTTGNWNQTNISSFNVTQTATNITLWIGVSGSMVNGNVSLVQGQTLNITATINTSYSVLLKINTTIGDGWVNQSTTGTRIENSSTTLNYDAANYYMINVSFGGDTNYTWSNATFWLNITGDTTGPAMKFFTPTVSDYAFNNSTAVKQGVSINLNVSVADIGIGMDNGEACFAKVGSAAAAQFAGYSSGWCNGSITVPALSDGIYLLNVTVNDTNNNTGYNDTYYITVDTTPPIITVTMPANGTYNKTTGSRTWANGTVSDNLQVSNLAGLVQGNISVNDTRFQVYGWEGRNNTMFNISNISAISDGYVVLMLNYTDNATNVGNTTVYFWVDNTAPQVIYGLMNSSAGTYQPNAVQTVQVRIDDMQTNGTITLHYAINDTDCGTWFTKLMTGTPGASTTYSTTINTIANYSRYCHYADGSGYVPYYVTGIDNATNAITSTVGGSIEIPFLANMTMDTYCGNNGTALGYCSYPTYPLTSGNFRSIVWSKEQLTNCSSLNGDYNISTVLASISGKYNFVYYENTSVTPHSWIAYDPNINWGLNTLRFANNTNDDYYVYVNGSSAVIRIV